MACFSGADSGLTVGQPVDEEPVALVGGHAAGAGVRLGDVAPPPRARPCRCGSSPARPRGRAARPAPWTHGLLGRRRSPRRSRAARRACGPRSSAHLLRVPLRGTCAGTRHDECQFTASGRRPSRPDPRGPHDRTVPTTSRRARRARTAITITLIIVSARSVRRRSAPTPAPRPWPLSACRDRARGRAARGRLGRAPRRAGRRPDDRDRQGWSRAETTTPACDGMSARHVRSAWVRPGREGVALRSPT